MDIFLLVGWGRELSHCLRRRRCDRGGRRTADRRSLQPASPADRRAARRRSCRTTGRTACKSTRSAGCHTFSRTPGCPADRQPFSLRQMLERRQSGGKRRQVSWPSRSSTANRSGGFFRQKFFKGKVPHVFLHGRTSTRREKEQRSHSFSGGQAARADSHRHAPLARTKVGKQRCHAGCSLTLSAACSAAEGDVICGLAAMRIASLGAKLSVATCGQR